MQQTIEQLKNLKLNGLLEAWAEQQAQPTYQDLAFDERFALLVEREYIRRQNQRLKRRLKQAQLFMGASLAGVAESTVGRDPQSLSIRSKSTTHSAMPFMGGEVNPEKRFML